MDRVGERPERPRLLLSSDRGGGDRREAEKGAEGGRVHARQVDWVSSGNGRNKSDESARETEFQYMELGVIGGLEEILWG